MVTKEEARQALKTIAQYCDEVDCYECEIKEACEKCEHQDHTFYWLHCLDKVMRKEKERNNDELQNRIKAEKLAPNMAAAIMNRKD